jgi:acyl-CoA synthetase (AMP-forming)/AMP-acid ligase II
MPDSSHFPSDRAATVQPEPQTLVDVIAQAAAAPAREALVFLNIRGEVSESVTYGALGAGARRLAANLQRHMRPGQAVLLAVEAQADFIFGFCGATLAGVVPAPVAPLRRKANAPEVQRILQILRGDGIEYLIVDRGEAGRARAVLAEAGLGAVTVLDIGALRDDPGGTFTPAAPGPEAIAYLQYTSGSTATPKGVVLRHRNVLANLRFMEKAFARTELVRVASWLPLHHDMGLVGHLFTILYERGFGVFMPPAVRRGWWSWCRASRATARRRASCCPILCRRDSR